MPIKSITSLYDFCEPMSGDNGEISLCMVPNGTAHTIVKKASDFDKSDVDMLNLINLEAWPIPNDFRKDEEGTESQKLDLRQLIFNCSCAVENYLRENISFVDERYYHICSIFIISTYFREDSTIFPRLIITGDTQSGKSRLQNAIRDLAYRCVKIGNGTFSSSFRTIDYYGTTTIFEEAQDYCRQDRAALMTIFKEGFEKGNVVSRCHPITFEPTQYRPESAMVISTRKTSILDDDVINRSFLIKMIRASNPKFARKRKDQKETDKIRTSLYHMKYVFTIQKSYYRERPNEHHFDLIKHIEDSCDMLITDNIEVQEGPDSKKEMMGFPELTNREFDIACAFYPFARITGHSLHLLQLLMMSKTNNVKKMVISDNGKIFRTWIELTREMCPRPKSRKMFRDVALRISTRDIRDRYVCSGRENGDIINDNDSIRTQDIRFPMTDMGFDLEYGKSTNGMTFVVPNGTFKNIFESNMKIYCDNEWNYDYLQLPEITGAPSISELAISKGGE